MKKLAPTLILVIVCIGLFWFAASRDFFREKEEVPQVLMEVKASEASSLIVTVDGETTEIKRTVDGDEWVMVQPDAFPLNQNQVDSWFTYVNGITQDMVVESDAEDLAKYGLAEPRIQLEVKLVDGRNRKLLVGDEAPVTGYVYARIDDGRTIYRVGQSSVNSAAKPTIEFIDRNPLKYDMSQVTMIQASWQGEQWTLTKSDKDKTAYESAWKLERKQDTKEMTGSDSSTMLSDARFWSTDQWPRRVSDLDVDTAELVIEVTEDSGEKQVYKGKVQDDEVWLFQSDSTWAYAISKASVEEWFNRNQEAE